MYPYSNPKEYQGLVGYSYCSPVWGSIIGLPSTSVASVVSFNHISTGLYPYAVSCVLAITPADIENFLPIGNLPLTSADEYLNPTLPFSLDSILAIWYLPVCLRKYLWFVNTSSLNLCFSQCNRYSNPFTADVGADNAVCFSIWLLPVQKLPGFTS